jgi:hypothetical protein
MTRCFGTGLSKNARQLMRLSIASETSMARMWWPETHE